MITKLNKTESSFISVMPNQRAVEWCLTVGEFESRTVRRGDMMRVNRIKNENY